MEEQSKTMTQAADTPGNQTVQLEIARSFEELKTTQEEWDTFVESMGSEIFLTYDWCRIWWKYYGNKRDLRIFVLRNGGNLTGVVPFFIEKIWLGPFYVKVAKLVGSDFTLAHFSPAVCSDHLGDMFGRIVEHLADMNCDLIHIGPVGGLYRDYDRLKEILTQSSSLDFRLSFQEDEVLTYFPLKESWESHLAGLSKNARRNIKRKLKALDEIFKDDSGSLMSMCAAEEDVEGWFAEFVKMHQEHWQKLGMPGHFGDWPDSFEFHRKMAVAQLRHNRLRLMVCRWGSFCIGYEYAYKFGQMYYAFLNARTDSQRVAKVNVGTGMFSEQVKKAMAEQVRYIDAMQCKYDYKLRLGGKLFPLRSIYIYRRNFLVAGRVFLFRLLSKVLDICYYKIWYCRVVRRLPLKRRPLWRCWIRSNTLKG